MHWQWNIAFVGISKAGVHVTSVWFMETDFVWSLGVFPEKDKLATASSSTFNSPNY